MNELSPAKHALLAKRLRAASAGSAEILQREPIAIVGMACRLPAGAQDLESYWNLMRDTQDAVTEIPKDRWDVDRLYDPDPTAPGKISTRCGAFLSEIDQFDAPFFSITPRESNGLDPQQRILLEVSYEALEDAGQRLEGLESSQTGVFIGATSMDYLFLQVGRELTRVNAYTVPGSSHSVLAGRLSYSFNLKGPSLAVDTACSSSLVAIHLACQSLRTGESQLALVGGVNAMVSPEA